MLKDEYLTPCGKQSTHTTIQKGKDMNKDDLETLKNEAKWMSQSTLEYKNVLIALEVIYKMGQESAERKSRLPGE